MRLRATRVIDGWRWLTRRVVGRTSVWLRLAFQHHASAHQRRRCVGCWHGVTGDLFVSATVRQYQNRAVRPRGERIDGSGLAIAIRHPVNDCAVGFEAVFEPIDRRAVEADKHVIEHRRARLQARAWRRVLRRRGLRQRPVVRRSSRCCLGCRKFVGLGNRGRGRVSRCGSARRCSRDFRCCFVRRRRFLNRHLCVGSGTIDRENRCRSRCCIVKSRCHVRASLFLRLVVDLGVLRVEKQTPRIVADVVLQL
ncbi:hypothetical protein AK36_3749 [Burkholderia vietnamiensis LMG 10929]|nr:hypothetical protein AK36_3749 [Burkholderia vietnamiensis LMG 10929]